MKQKLTVLVTGATGRQGGAVARMLLERGHAVHAYTRHPESDAARLLERLGAEVFQGSFDERTKLEHAAGGCTAWFAMTTPYEQGPDAEIAQGFVQCEVAKSLGIRHFVYTSIASADQHTRIPHFDSKDKIERHIRELGMPHTIVAPVFFCDNLLANGLRSELARGRLPMALPADRPLQMVAVDDIGRFVCLVLEDRAGFLDERIELASCSVTPLQAASIVAKACGRRIEFVELPLDDLRHKDRALARMFEWFDRVGYSVDVAALRREHPEIGWHDFSEWAVKQDWSVLGAPGRAQNLPLR